MSNFVSPRVNACMNDFLCSSFSTEEVKKVTFELGSEKALCPNGMPRFFFQKFLDVVGKDVTEAVLEVLNSGASLDNWNNTIITLLPKISEPLMVKEFRPISLSNFCYKIVARAFTNRLRSIIDAVIDETQCAFVLGRLITDNILIGFECMHWIQNHRNYKKGYTALKLDMSKAYDRIEWDFLEAIMVKLGFNGRWVENIMRCVKSISYIVKFNNNLLEHFFGKGNKTRGPFFALSFYFMCSGLFRSTIGL